MASYLSYFSRDASASFPYEIGAKIPNDDSQSIWSVHEGKNIKKIVLKISLTKVIT